MNILTKSGKSATTGFVVTMAGLGDVVTNNNGSAISVEGAAVLTDPRASTDKVDTFVSNFETVASDIEQAYNKGFGLESTAQMPLAGKQAATVIAMAAGNMVGFATAGYNVSTDNISIENNSGAFGQVAQNLSVSNESFDSNNLSSHVKHSIMFNAMSAQQDEFGEAFYPTIVMTPDQPGYEVTVTNTVVMNAVKHALNAATTDFEKRTLIDAMVDADILTQNAVDIIPSLVDGTNDHAFIDKALVQPSTVEVDGVDIVTNWLQVNHEFNLISLSQRPGTVNAQQRNHTDQIAMGSKLGAVLLKVSNADGSKTSLISYDVSGLPRNFFNKSTEGASRDTTIQFKNGELLLTKDTADLAGTAADAAAAIPTGVTAKIAINLVGEMNLETGTTVLNPISAKVAAVFDADGVKLSTQATGVGKDVADGIKVEVVGWKVSAKLSNTNVAAEGLLVETSTQKEIYNLQLGQPFSTQYSVNGDGEDVKGLINLSRTTTANNSVTRLLNYLETLRTYVENNPSETGKVPDVEGIGRFAVKPTCITDGIDFKEADAVKTRRQAEIREDIQARLVDRIRHVAYRMDVESNYSSALKAENEGGSTKPRLVIGTDPITAQYLMVTGDDRTLSIGMDHTVVTTQDKRMRGKIVLAFSRGKTDKPDWASLGSHGWMPEATFQITKNVGNGEVQQLTVQPRSDHFNHCPVMGFIEVKNINEAT